uniref:Transposase n=1 Tax=Vibrio parahaemolyticus TaxID=670 RepID=A0A1Y1B9J7_VIBPH|nr:transposase [Vibrio parahaemolyticus]BAX57069.1 transposase [Vibrio parahaemolyticus]
MFRWATKPLDGSKSNHAALNALNMQLWLTGYFMLSLVESGHKISEQHRRAEFLLG